MMLSTIPSYVSLAFVLTTFATWVLFYSVLKNATTNNVKSGYIMSCLTAWLIIQAVLSLNQFFSTNTNAVPPRFLVLILPPLLFIASLFITKKGRAFMDGLPLLQLTYLNTVRIPVEVVLYWLYLNKAVPELMTFAGRNFDILAGISAPLLAYLGLRKQKLSKKVLLWWNIAALALLLNIVIHAVLSAPFAFQRLAFDQPNIGVLYFPFVWLPAFIVPVVLFGHLVSIRQLTR